METYYASKMALWSTRLQATTPLIRPYYYHLGLSPESQSRNKNKRININLSPSTPALLGSERESNQYSIGPIELRLCNPSLAISSLTAKPPHSPSARGVHIKSVAHTLLIIPSFHHSIFPSCWQPDIWELLASSAVQASEDGESFRAPPGY